MKLRRMISYTLPNGGWKSEEKDPEELINALFGTVLRADPDFYLTTGQSSRICQIIVDDNFQKAPLTSVQTLLERSFFHSNVMLASMPDRFIVQLPRSGKEKIYDFIVPTLKLDLSNVLASCDRKCTRCGQYAKWQCKECYLVETNDYSRRSSATYVTHGSIPLYRTTATICLQACLAQRYLPCEIKINVWNWRRFFASRILITSRSFVSRRDSHRAGYFSTAWRIAKVAILLAIICPKWSDAISITTSY